MLYIDIVVGIAVHSLVSLCICIGKMSSSDGKCLESIGILNNLPELGKGVTNTWVKETETIKFA